VHYLGLVLDLHLCGREELGVDPLWQTSVHLLPRRPDGDAHVERAANGEDDVPDDVPEVGVEEEHDQVHDVHDPERELDLVLADHVPEHWVRAVEHLRARHDRDSRGERGREEEVRLRELEAKDERPERHTRRTCGPGERCVRGREGLRGHVLARLACDTITEHTARGDHTEGDRGGDGEAELNYTDNLRDGRLRLAVHHRDVDRRAAGDCKNNQEEEQPGGQVRGVVPGGRDVRELENGGEDHEDRGHSSAERGRRPGHGRRGLGGQRRRIHVLGVVRSVEPPHGDVQNPHAVEVDEEVGR
jgi:hypothetical protein